MLNGPHLGAARTSFAPPISITGGSGGGGSATNGDINVPGGTSGIAFATTTVIGWSGSGGDSRFGKGAGAVTTGSGAGANGTAAGGYGAGGSGAYSSSNAGGSKGGGNGSDGLIIIWEYA